MIQLPGKASDFLKIGVAAAGRGDLVMVREVLEVQPQWVARVGSHGRTMLWEAAYRGRADVAEYLLDAGADLDAWGCHFTPLLVEISPYCAARFRKRAAVVTLLRARGASDDVCSSAFLGDLDAVVDHVSKKPALVTQEWPQHDPNVRPTLLHYAVSGKHASIVAFLLERGADPQPYSHWLGRFAVWRGNRAVLEMLLDAGLDAQEAKLAAGDVRDDGIREILSARGVLRDVDSAHNGWPALVYLSRGDRGGDVERVRKLLAQGADVDARNHKGQTALHCAAKAGFVDIVDALLAAGASVNARDDQGEPPLTTALRSTVKDKSRLQDVVRLLVECGADVNLADRQGRSALAVARKKRGPVDWVGVLEV